MGPLAGFRIIEMAGKAVSGMADYNVIRATLTAGVEIEIKILRDKKEMTLKVTPAGTVTRACSLTLAVSVVVWFVSGSTTVV